MEIERQDGGARLTLDAAEVELLALALQRASFEDTPPDRQQEIVEFAMSLRRALDEDVPS